MGEEAAAINELVVNGIRYLRAPEIGNDVRICVLDRGWVVIGTYTETNGICELHNAAVIRIWGTTGTGLPSLATGPKSETKLDKCPAGNTIRFRASSEILTINCDAKAWQCLR